jgi:hypothetical protein
MGQMKSFLFFILCREGRRRLERRDDHPHESATLHDPAYA